MLETLCQRMTLAPSEALNSVGERSAFGISRGQSEAHAAKRDSVVMLGPMRGMSPFDQAPSRDLVCVVRWRYTLCPLHASAE